METKLTFDAHLRIFYFMKWIYHVPQKYWLEYVNKSIRHKTLVTPKNKHIHKINEFMKSGHNQQS